MINKTLEITAFLKKHYSPGNIETVKEDLQLTSEEVLMLLFQVFPSGCIDVYDLHEILTNLGYDPQKKNSTKFVLCLKENE